MKYISIPTAIKQANQFVADHHRHHKPVYAARFAVGCIRPGEDELVGVAIAGNPVARALADGFTLEINRVAVKEGNPNACSFLISRVVKIARVMGYDRIYSCILDSENGASLSSAGFFMDGLIKGKTWSHPSRIRTDKHPVCDKKRYCLQLTPFIRNDKGKIIAERPRKKKVL